MESPKTTRQWIIFSVKNASMIVLLLGALWNYGEIIYDGISGTDRGQRQEQERQLSLWSKNKECLKNKPESFETDKKEMIQLLLCPKTASLLVEIVPPDVKLSTSKWIELNRVEEHTSLFSLYAQEIQRVRNGSVTIELCRYSDDKFLTIIRKIDNVCWITVTNLESGERATKPIICESGCR